LKQHLADSDSSTCNNHAHPHSTIAEVLKKEYTEVKIKKGYDGQDFFFFIANKEVSYHITLKRTALAL
jgi:hypothetical protein